MSIAAPSTVLAAIQPVFTDTKRVALAGFLAGYRCLTRELSLSATALSARPVQNTARGAEHTAQVDLCELDSQHDGSAPEVCCHAAFWSAWRQSRRSGAFGTLEAIDELYAKASNTLEGRLAEDGTEGRSRWLDARSEVILDPLPEAAHLVAGSAALDLANESEPPVSRD
jgi:hypothetical protein